MNVVLDTQALLWFLLSPKLLSKDATAVLKNPQTVAHMSVVSLWEISIKFTLGKLELNGISPVELYSNALGAGLQTLNLEPEETATFYKLKLGVHRDPFDRLLVWQTLRRDWVLLSADGALPEYRALGLKLVW